MHALLFKKKMQVYQICDEYFTQQWLGAKILITTILKGNLLHFSPNFEFSFGLTPG
jgi:hypothetical protein